jgi:hypothetical protein
MLTCLFVLAFVTAVPGEAPDPKAGQHNGEVKQLEVEIAFSDSYGTTVTTEDGTYYNVWGFTFFEPLI